MPCLGGQLQSRGFTAERNEILCRAIAYNLARLVYLGLDRGIEIDFAGGADVLRRTRWRSLRALAAEGEAEGYKCLTRPAPSGTVSRLPPSFARPGANPKLTRVVVSIDERGKEGKGWDAAWRATTPC